MSSFRQLMMKKKNGQTLNPLIKIVGSPTITSDFIYKNVGANDYIYINEVLPLSTANSWKIKFKMKFYHNPESIEYVTALIGYYGNNSNDGKSPVLRTDWWGISNNLRCLISKAGYSNWNINSDYANYWLTDNQEYDIEFAFTGTQYYVKNLLTNTTMWSKSTSDKCECSNFISLFHNGYRSTYDEYCGGEMDLKTFEVYINDSLYFSAIV